MNLFVASCLPHAELALSLPGPATLHANAAARAPSAATSVAAFHCLAHRIISAPHTVGTVDAGRPRALIGRHIRRRLSGGSSSCGGCQVIAQHLHGHKLRSAAPVRRGSYIRGGNSRRAMPVTRHAGAGSCAREGSASAHCDVHSTLTAIAALAAGCAACIAFPARLLRIGAAARRRWRCVGASAGAAQHTGSQRARQGPRAGREGRRRGSSSAQVGQRAGRSGSGCGEAGGEAGGVASGGGREGRRGSGGGGCGRGGRAGSAGWRERKGRGRAKACARASRCVASALCACRDGVAR